MPDTKLSILLVADFTSDNLAALMSKDGGEPKVEAQCAPFGQVLPILSDERHDVWNRPWDAAVVWTRPESIIRSFHMALANRKINENRLMEEVDIYCGALKSAAERVRFLIVCSWILPPLHRGTGMADLKPPAGPAYLLMQMNLRLARELARVDNAALLNADRWIAVAGSRACNPKLWYMGKILFGEPLLAQAVADVKAALAGFMGKARKLILVDLDDTLWGGIVGDEGWENLRIGGHDGVGEAYVDFQNHLLSLKQRGVVLGIVSKNEEKTALEALEKHPEMRLGPSDFAAWRINWEDKARNIADLADQLNLGLQSIVFIDDNPVERDRVKTALPEVLVPDLPKDVMMRPSFLAGLTCFDTPSLSGEDRRRTEMYRSESQRNRLRSSLKTTEQWLETLGVEVTVEPILEKNMQRLNQLFNKTNQMNLSTRRMSASEILEWVSRQNRWFWTFRVNDKFGDSGLTGILSLEKKNNAARIVDFILSCRVMGRRVEQAMIWFAVDRAKKMNADIIQARYLPTPKNKPCLAFWIQSGFVADESKTLFHFNLEKTYPKPECIRVCTKDE